MKKLPPSTDGNIYQAFCSNLLSPVSGIFLSIVTFISAIAFAHYNHPDTAMLLMFLGIYFITLAIVFAIETGEIR